MSPVLAIALCNLLVTQVLGPSPADSPAGSVLPTEASPTSPAALVVVAVPEGANRAILEAVNRLRGEAASVGLEVRVIHGSADTVSSSGGEQGSRPVAIVTFAGPEEGTHPPASLSVTYVDPATGRRASERLTIERPPQRSGGLDREDVVLAVRAVDFVRSCMMHTLAVRDGAAEVIADRPVPAPTPAPASRHEFYLAAGAAILTASGFSASVLPRLDLGYRPARWFRLRLMGFGFGSRPPSQALGGSVSLDHRYVGVGITMLGPSWRRLAAFGELDVGELWTVVRGQGLAPYVSKSATSSSPAVTLSVGLAVAVAASISVEVHGGALLLQNEARVHSTDAHYVGSIGRPSWFGGGRLAYAF